MLGKSLDKGARFTDWARRPLDKRQIDYAIGDVTYLATLFPKMLSRLKKTGRGDWLDQEMERLATPPITPTIRRRPGSGCGCRAASPRVLGPPERRSRWREIEARQKNLPRGRIMKDETLPTLPRTPRRPGCAGAGCGASRRAGRPTTSGAADGRARLRAPPAASEMPPREDRSPGSARKARWSRTLLKLLLKIRARESNVAARLVARSDELELLAAGQARRLSILRAGDSRSSGATRSTWSRGGLPLQSRTASSP
jgi:ribonuclease D